MKFLMRFRMKRKKIRFFIKNMSGIRDGMKWGKNMEIWDGDSWDVFLKMWNQDESGRWLKPGDGTHIFIHWVWEKKTRRRPMCLTAMRGDMRWFSTRRWRSSNQGFDFDPFQKTWTYLSFSCIAGVLRLKPVNTSTTVSTWDALPGW